MMYVFYFCVYTHVGSYQFINIIRVPARCTVENKCLDLELFDKKLDLVGIIWRPKLKISGTFQNNREIKKLVLDKIKFIFFLQLKINNRRDYRHFYQIFIQARIYWTTYKS